MKAQKQRLHIYAPLLHPPRSSTNSRHLSVNKQLHTKTTDRDVHENFITDASLNEEISSKFRKSSYSADPKLICLGGSPRTRDVFVPFSSCIAVFFLYSLPFTQSLDIDSGSTLHDKN